MTVQAIQFLFDYISPYAYLASTQIRSLAGRHGCTVDAVPVLFAGLLGATGARGPAEIPLRRAYLFRDIVRLSRALDVPIAVPATHPFNPLAALRATTAVADPLDRWRLVEGLYRATWVESRRIDQPEVVREVAREQGLDGAALLERGGSAEVKTALRRATDEAIAAGAFGVPSMLVNSELFWGVDSLSLLERFLEGERIDPSLLAAFHGLGASAKRKEAP